MIEASLHHTGIVVRNIQDHFEKHLKHLFDKKLGPTIEDPEQQARVCFIEIPGGRIELIEPSNTGSPLAAFAEKHPAGLHHICLEVPDLASALDQCRRARQIIVSPPKPAVAFQGRKIAFVAGRDRLLWELLQANPD